MFDNFTGSERTVNNLKQGKTDRDDTSSDALQTRRMQRCLIWYAIFITPFIIVLCITAFLLSGSWYAFSGLSGLLLPTMIFGVPTGTSIRSSTPASIQGLVSHSTG